MVLEEGRVVERGSHAELVAAGGRYWALLRRQQLTEALEDEDVAAEPQAPAAVPAGPPEPDESTAMAVPGAEGEV